MSAERSFWMIVLGGGVRRRWRERQRGSVAIMVAVSFAVMALVAGAVMDFGRAYLLKVRLQQTADAAALAANTLPEAERTFDNLKKMAKDYYDTDQASKRLGPVEFEEPTFTESDGTFKVDLVGKLDTTLLKLAGINTLTVRASAVSFRKPGPMEIALALDMTVSMAQPSKIGVAKRAIKELLDTMAAPRNVTDANTKMGIAFFNATTTLAMPTAGVRTPDSRTSWDPEKIDGTKPLNWNGCVGMKARPGDSVADLKAMNFVYAAATETTCYNLRFTEPTVAYAFPLPAIIPLTGLKTGKEKIESVLDSIYDQNPPYFTLGRTGAFGATYVPSGIFAAFTLLRPNQPFPAFDEDTNPSGPRTPTQLQLVGGTKNLIIFADGWNTIGMSTTASTDNFKTGAALPSVIKSTQYQLCQNIKKYGTSQFDGPANGTPINVFVVAFNFIASETAFKAELRDCASDPAFFFESNNEAQLKQNFKDIGLLIQRLRLAS